MKIVEVTLRFRAWKTNEAILQDVVDMATELRAKDSSMDVVNVDIGDEDEGDTPGDDQG